MSDQTIHISTHFDPQGKNTPTYQVYRWLGDQKQNLGRYTDLGAAHAAVAEVRAYMRLSDAATAAWQAISASREAFELGYLDGAEGTQAATWFKTDPEYTAYTIAYEWAHQFVFVEKPR
jgi:hypothetical protein